MIWKNKEGFRDYSISLSSLKKLLGIEMVDYEVRPELAPYLVYIIKHLNNLLVDAGESASTIDKLKVIFDEHERGADLIVGLKGINLAKEIGIETDNTWGSVNDFFVPYEEDRFVFCWTDVMSSLITRLKIQYAHLLVDPVIQGCKCTCGCGTGETTKDWEKYTSGVWPEDEKYSNLDYGTTSSWRLGNDKPECTCCSRR